MLYPRSLHDDELKKTTGFRHRLNLMFVETTAAAVNASAFVYYAATSPKCASLFIVICTIIECPLKPKYSTCSPPPVLQLVLTVENICLHSQPLD